MADEFVDVKDVRSRWLNEQPEAKPTRVDSASGDGVDLNDVKNRWLGSPDVSVTPEGRLAITIRPKPSYDAGAGYQQQMVEGMPIVGPLFNKAVAASGAAVEPFFRSGLPSTFGERYTKNLSDIIGESKRFADENPVGSTVANLTGGVMALGPLAGSKIGGAILGTYGPTLGSRIATGAAGGAGIGALDALLRGDSTVTGAGIGAAGGLAGPIIGEGVRHGTNIASNYFAPRIGALKDVTSSALGRLTGALEGETSASLAAAKSRMGPAGFMGDVNPAMTDIAGGIADTPGPGKAIIREAYRVRAAQQAARIDNALTTHIGPKTNIEDFKNATIQERARAADPLYEQWRSASIHPTDELKALIPRLEKSGAFDMAERLSGISGKPINKAFFTTGKQKEFPTAESWDYVKRGLDSKIDQAYSAGDKTLARSLVGLKQDMLDEIEKTSAGKIWKQARSEFADRSAILDQVEAGRDTFLGGRSGLSVDELRAELKGLSGPELAARITGMRNAVDHAMGDSIRGDTTLRNKLLAPNNQEKMRLLLGEDKAKKLIQTMEQEKFLGEQHQNISGGSQTTPKKERVDALKPAALPHYNPSLVEPFSLIPPHVREALRPSTIIDAWRGQHAASTVNKLADLMVTPSGPKMDDLISAIHKEAMRRSAVNAKSSLLANRLSALAVPAETTLRRQLPAAQ